MFGIAWRLILLGFCCVLYLIPFVNLMAFLATPILLPVGAYCGISAAARIWRRNTVA